MFWLNTKLNGTTQNQSTRNSPKSRILGNHQIKIKKTIKILTRLTIGHTLMTHKYILEKSARLSCPTCNNCPIAVQHILTDFPNYGTERSTIKLHCRNHQLRLNLKTLLRNNHPELISLLFQFLPCTNLNNQI